MTKPKYPTSGTQITVEMLPWCLTLQQAAEVLGIAYRTMQHYIDEGRIPYIDLGWRTKRIYYKDLEDYVNNRREIDEALVKFFRRSLANENKQAAKLDR